MSLVVIKTGGKQYLVGKKDKLKIEKLKVEERKEVVFKDVLLVADKKGSEVSVGNPIVKGAKVTAKVLQQGKLPKITGAHYKPKTRNRKFFGHRQSFTEIEITKIEV